MSGKPLTTRAIGYELWRLADGRRFERATPPQLPRTPERLAEMRGEAIREVRRLLATRAREHLVAAAERREPVYGLRMLGEHAGAVYVPAGGWHGLPGLYSSDWATPIGRRGEATRAEADEAVSRGVCELVELDARAMAEVVSRFHTAAPDDAAVAERVASRFCRQESRAVERHVERFLSEINTWEYKHLGTDTGRRPLPAAR